MSEPGKILSHKDSYDLKFKLNWTVWRVEFIAVNIATTNSVFDIMQFIHNNQYLGSYSHCSSYFNEMHFTVTSGERIFSKLKLRITNLRSTMSQERVTGLDILSIEQEITSSLSFYNTITELANRKGKTLILNEVAT